MKRLSVTLLVTAVAIAGCGKQEPATPTASPPSTAPAKPAMPSLQTGGGTAAPAGPSAAAAPTPPPAIDFASADRPVNEGGQPISDLEFLNQVLETYRMRASTSDPATALAGRRFKSQDEEAAAVAALRKKNRIAVSDLSELVKAGMIKSIPAAPPGKKYIIDQKSGQVVLADQ